MGSVSNIEDQERALCVAAAIAMAREVIKDERGGGFVAPSTRLDMLSDWQMNKLAEAFISGWIIERGRLLTKDRLNEQRFLAMGEEPEPYTLGVCQAVLPDLGDFVEKRKLADLPIGAWSKTDITLFVRWTADLVAWAETQRDERPTDPDTNHVLMAG